MAKTEAELRAKIDALIMEFRADREADRQILVDLQASGANLQSAVTQLQVVEIDWDSTIRLYRDGALANEAWVVDGNELKKVPVSELALPIPLK